VLLYLSAVLLIIYVLTAVIILFALVHLKTLFKFCFSFSKADARLSGKASLVRAMEDRTFSMFLLFSDRDLSSTT
jgi:hypothetical protein